MARAKSKVKVFQTIPLYLECEKALRKFFDSIDFCLEHCIKGDGTMEMFTELLKGVGCCYGDRTIPQTFGETNLNAQRVEKHGLGMMREGRCRYHTNSGCNLEDMKPPQCISNACTYLQRYLESEFGIDYNAEFEEFGGAKDFLRNVLDGRVEPEDSGRFV
ncbi:MAG: hypothetical protein ABIE22_05100, partial [archaeon]